MGSGGVWDVGCGISPMELGLGNRALADQIGC